VARRWQLTLGLAGGLLMAASLLLPSSWPPRGGVVVLDPLNVALPEAPRAIQLIGIVLLLVVLGVAAYRPRWLWAPAGLWACGWIYISFRSLWPVLHYPEPPVATRGGVPLNLLAAFVGAGFVFLATRRERTALVGVKAAAGLSILASLRLPVAEPFAHRRLLGRMTLSNLPDLSLLLLGLALVTTVLLFARPRWARLPALLWLGVVAVLLNALLGTSLVVLPIGWIAALGGGLLAVAAAWVDRPKTTPVDVSAFD
jgi:hypothetical protein